MAEIPNKLQKLFAKIENKRGIYLRLTGVLDEAVQKNFETEGQRLGKGWQKLSPKYAKRKARNKSAAQSILQLHGFLLRSMQTTANDDYAAVGTNLIYAAIHQYGGIIHQSGLSRHIHKRIAGRKSKKPKGNRMWSIRMPARPFLALNDEDMQDIIDEATDYLVN